MSFLIRCLGDSHPQKANTDSLNGILPEGKAGESFERQSLYVGRCSCAKLDRLFSGSVTFHLKEALNFLSSLLVCKQLCSVSLPSPSSLSFGVRPEFSKFLKVKK